MIMMVIKPVVNSIGPGWGLRLILGANCRRSNLSSPYIGAGVIFVMGLNVVMIVVAIS